MEERDVIIVGAGPAGLSAAIFTQLDGWSTLVPEADLVGGQGTIA
jgi:thioredoxin reductase